MLKIHRINRCLSVKRIYPAVSKVCRYSSNSDDNDAKSIDKNRRKEALTKLNDLLKDMVNDKVDNSIKPLNLAKPKNRRGEKKELKGEKPFALQVESAVKAVAEKVGGDVKQTESVLLTKLLGAQKVDTSAALENLSDIVKGMRIDRESKAPETVSRSEEVRRLIAAAKRQQEQSMSRSVKLKQHGFTRPEKRRLEMVPQKINLFGEKPLGIFAETADSTALNEGSNNRTWQRLYEREMKLAITHPPANYFQQMILWTEQGKVWKFPIDNEQGMEEEQAVYFTEHVFLEKHLEPWCPAKGPIRHFMDLVCVGLSKNPYMTVQTKKEHIEWYKKYFEDKKNILLEVGAIPAAKDEVLK